MALGLLVCILHTCCPFRMPNILLGGGSATATSVSSCSALESALGASGSAVITFSGTISGCGVIDIESNKTVLGVGSSA